MSAFAFRGQVSSVVLASASTLVSKEVDIPFRGAKAGCNVIVGAVDDPGAKIMFCGFCDTDNIVTLRYLNLDTGSYAGGTFKFHIEILLPNNLVSLPLGVGAS